MIVRGEIPFVRLLLPLAAGITAAYYLPSEYFFRVTGWLLFMSGCVFMLTLVYYSRCDRRIVQPLCSFLITTILFVFGYHLTAEISRRFESNRFELYDAGFLAGQITGEPRYTDSLCRFEVDMLHAYDTMFVKDVSGKMMVSLRIDPASHKGLKYGDQILFPAKYDSILPPLNPGEFNYKNYLADRQVHYQAFFGQNELNLISRGHGDVFIRHALSLRKKLVEKFEKYIHDKDAAAFASTLILGYRAELSRELVEAYSNTGTMHVLSVSGMHVGIVFMVLVIVLRFMDRSRSLQLIRAVVIVSVIWFYALISGFSAPACRAAVMLSFIVIGKAISRRQNTYNLVAISAFVLLLYNPYFLFDAGFQLSFVAVLGLIYFHPYIYRSVYIRNRAADQVWNYCALSISAQLATLPASVYYFHQFPVYFLFSNLLIVLPTAVIMYLGIAFMFITSELILRYAGSILESCIKVTNDILYYIEALPLAVWDGIWINRIDCLLLYLILAAVIAKLSFAYKYSILGACALTIIFVSGISLKKFSDFSGSRVIYLSLRKHSGFIFQENGKSIIVTTAAADEKVKDFSLRPTAQRFSSTAERYYFPGMNFVDGRFSAQSGLYQLGSYRLMHWTPLLDTARLHSRIRVSTLLISGDPHIDLEQALQHVIAGMVIIDSNNSDRNSRKWTNDATRLHIPFYLLKKNKALTVRL